jgi:hypothetical protein
MSSSNDWLGFNPQETEAAESFSGGRQEAIPEGRYKAVVTSAVRKHTKKKQGWFWELIFTVDEGQYTGRSVTHRFNMANPSEEAVAIGRSQLKRYLDAIGNQNPRDEGELCNIAVWIDVVCRKNAYVNRKGEQAEGIFNEITKIDSFTSRSAPPKAQTEQSSVPPWQQKGERS